MPENPGLRLSPADGFCFYTVAFSSEGDFSLCQPLHCPSESASRGSRGSRPAAGVAWPGRPGHVSAFVSSLPACSLGNSIL